jgi:hypothetical protein
MKVVIKNSARRELVIATLETDLAALKLAKLPTSCLISMAPPIDVQRTKQLAKDCIALDCRHFVSWGPAAEEVEELIDDVIESGPEEQISIVTTSHDEEPIEDLLAFFVQATFFGTGKYRYLAILDPGYPGSKPLAEKLIELHCDDA